MSPRFAPFGVRFVTSPFRRYGGASFLSALVSVVGCASAPVDEFAEANGREVGTSSWALTDGGATTADASPGTVPPTADAGGPASRCYVTCRRPVPPYIFVEDFYRVCLPTEIAQCFCNPDGSFGGSCQVPQGPTPNLSVASITCGVNIWPFTATPFFIACPSPGRAYCTCTPGPDPAGGTYPICGCY